MASLGKLWFELGMRDRTDKDIAEIRKGIEKRLKELNVDIGLNGEALRRSIEDALAGRQFKVGILVDKASATKAVQDALARAGYTASVRPDDVRAARIEEINKRIANSYEESQAKVKKLQAQIDRLRSTHVRASSSASKYSGALGGVTKNMRTQFNLAVQLRNQLANIYSVYAAERFLTSVIEIGGEFQKQRVALQTMFQDAQKADILFGQIKELAVESPFEFKELAGYTKQLAAFNIPYEEMYDTTKRLADISAGVGVDMGRIILAYGQVRSAEFLKGTELRQFTEAGIPLLQQLADKFTELEGRVVSVGEVFDRISTRQVSFQMVKDVLWDLTSEGGQFYNMQGALADTLAGKLSNLRDAYDVMLADIAESNNSTLSAGLDLLTDTMNNWEKLADIVLTAVAAYGTYKVALVVLTVAEKAYKSVQMSSVLLNRTQAMLNALRATQGLTSATKAQIIAQRGLNAVMKANPIVLVASALAALVGSYMLFSDKVKSTDEMITGLNESVGHLQKSFEDLSNTDKMIDEYEELSNKQSKTTEESRKLDTITNTLYERFGGAAEKADEYGKAIGLSAEKMRELNKQQKENIIAGVNVELKEAEDRADKVRAQIDELTNEISKGANVNATSMGQWGTYISGYTQKDIDNFKKQRKDYQNELNRLEDSAKKTREFLKGLGEAGEDANLENALSGWRKAVADFIAGNRELKDLTPKDKEEYVDWYKRLSDALSEAKSDLDKMKGTVGLFDDDTIKRQQEYLDGLESIRKRFNIPSKGGSSETKDWESVLQDQMKSLRSERLSAEYQLEQSVINLMSEGGEKEIAQIKLNHRKRLAEIEKQSDELVNKAREAEKAQWMAANPGRDERDFKSSVSGVEDLPDDFQKVLSGLLMAENESYKKAITDYYEGVADEFKGYIERRKAIEEEYARKRADMFKSGASKESIQEADYQEKKSLQALDLEIAQRQETFQSWVDEIAGMGVEELRKLLIEAQAELMKLEISDSLDGEDLAKYRAIIVEIRKELDKTNEEESSASDSGDWEKKYATLNKISRSFTEIGDSVGGTAGEIIKQAGKISSSILQIVNAVKTLKNGLKGLDEASVVLAIISAVLEAASGLFNLLNGPDPIEEFWKSARALNEELVTLKENLRIDNESNNTIFGDNKWKNAIGNVRAAIDALKDYNDTLEEIAQRKPYTSFDADNWFGGADRAVDYSNLEEFFEGFKSAEESLANMQVQTRHSTWFRRAKYTSLAEAVPELFDEEGKVDMDMLVEFQDSDVYKGLSQMDREYIDQMINDWNTYQDAVESVNNYLTDIFGNLGDTMMDALVSAFENGTDAAQAFTDSVSDMLEQLATNMIYSVTLGPVFEKAQQEMLDIMNDESLSDDKRFESFTSVLEGMTTEALAQQDMATSLMKQYKEIASENGLDIYTPEEDTSSSTLSAGIQGVTEDTANLLGSYLNAIRQDVSVMRHLQESLGGNLFPTMSVTAQAQLQQLNAIAENTRLNAEYAKRIDNFLNGTLSGVITNGNGGRAIRIK